MFKKLVIAASLALSGCLLPLGGVASPGSPISATQVTLRGSDALSKATDAYAGVSIIAAGVVRQGVLNHNQLLMLRSLNNRALVLINGANTGLSDVERASSLFLIVTQIHSIVGR